MEPSDCALDRMMDITKNAYNLEYFPMEVLLKFFARKDDIGLTYLAENSS